MTRAAIALFAAAVLLAQTTAMAWAAHPPAAAADAADAMPCHAESADPVPAPCEGCTPDCPLACGSAPLPAGAAAIAVDPPARAFAALPVAAPRASPPCSPFRPPAA